MTLHLPRNRVLRASAPQGSGLLVAGGLDQQLGVVLQQRPQVQVVPKVKLGGQVHHGGVVAGDSAANPA
jgi:hypothetical protein